MGNRWFSFQLHSPLTHQGASLFSAVTEVNEFADMPQGKSMLSFQSLSRLKKFN
jgi:hypothetical protein